MDKSGDVAVSPAPGYDTDRVWTLPNGLSLLRLAGVPLFLWLVLGPQADGLAVLVLIVAGFTDWLDGYLARKWKQRSRMGQMLDPVADRFYILATLLGLAIRGIVPWWLVVILVARDFVITMLVPILKT
nr:CDP-alcohol phosphatidyltransferase family protein [Propionibacteriaceae bacterium]